MIFQILLTVLLYIICVHYISIYGYKICNTKLGWYFLNSSKECKNCVCKYAQTCKRNTVYLEQHK